jgi:polyphosphate glucokinase
MTVLGIDIGGSGIKGGLVDIQTGEMAAARHRLATPEDAMPDDVAEVVNSVRQHFEYQGPIGIGFPAIVQEGVARSAANIDQSWIGVDVEKLVGDVTGCPTFVLNDADAAGIAEMEFGAGREMQRGVVLMLTIGTGIGSAVFVDRHLLPNTEFGHIEIKGKDAERRASDATRKRKNLTWEQWAQRLQVYLSTMEMLIGPDLIIIGGGVSKTPDLFFPYLEVRAKMVPAELQNEAGIIGAAMYAAQRSNLVT